MPNDENIVSLLNLNDNEYNHKFNQLLKEIKSPIVRVFLNHHLNNMMVFQERLRYLGFITRNDPDGWDGDLRIKTDMDKFWETMRKQVKD